MATTGHVRRGKHSSWEVRSLLRKHAAVAERIGLVEEDDDSAVSQRELSQLPEQTLHLEHADAHEHVDERAGIDEDVRSPGLAGDGLGHQRLAGARRAPQKQAAGDVATLLLDRLRPLQEDDVLLHLRQHVVLSPHIGKAGLDVVRVVDVDPAAGQEPEDRNELEHDDKQDREDLQQHRKDLPQDRGRLEERENRRGVEEGRRDNREHRDPEHPLQHPREAEARPVAEPAVGEPLETAEDPPGPELVIAGPPLTDEEVNLAQDLQTQQHQNPRRRRDLHPHCLDERHDRGVLGHRGPDEKEPDQREQNDELEPVPQLELRAGRPVAVLRSGLGWSQALHRRRRGLETHC